VVGGASRVVAGASRLTNEVQNAATKAGTATVGGLQGGLSATYKGVKGAGEYG